MWRKKILTSGTNVSLILVNNMPFEFCIAFKMIEKNKASANSTRNAGSHSLNALNLKNDNKAYENNYFSGAKFTKSSKNFIKNEQLRNLKLPNRFKMNHQNPLGQNDRGISPFSDHKRDKSDSSTSQPPYLSTNAILKAQKI